eukprot:7666751-Ditylum_brightwellii.AAC.1
MDAYPGDLAGALPLVFAVNAVLSPPRTEPTAADSDSTTHDAVAGGESTSSLEVAISNQSAGSSTTEGGITNVTNDESKTEL